MGGGVIAALDKIVTSNKTQDNKITVKYKETETQEENEITSIKQTIKKFDNYDITFDYDANGFINKATIETLYEEDNNDSINHNRHFTNHHISLI